MTNSRDEFGNKKYKCRRCGLTLVGPINALVHEYVVHMPALYRYRPEAAEGRAKYWLEKVIKERGDIDEFVTSFGNNFEVAG